MGRKEGTQGQEETKGKESIVKERKRTEIKRGEWRGTGRKETR